MQQRRVHACSPTCHVRARMQACLRVAGCRRDARVAALLRERYGMTDMSKLVCDTWACHGAPEHLNHRRLMQGFL